MASLNARAVARSRPEDAADAGDGLHLDALGVHVRDAHGEIDDVARHAAAPPRLVAHQVEDGWRDVVRVDVDDGHGSSCVYRGRFSIISGRKTSW